MKFTIEINDTYDRISRSIDAINDIVLDRLSDNDARAVMAQEAEILSAVAEIDRPRSEGRE